MVLSVVQRAKAAGIAVPGAVVSVSPGAADLSKTGDTWYTLAGVDGIGYDGFWEGVFKYYVNGRDLKDPAVSPLYGDFKGFPPTYLLAGTRDIFLSDTVRAQRKLMQANVSTQLVVIEGLNHGGRVCYRHAGSERGIRSDRSVSRCKARSLRRSPDRAQRIGIWNMFLDRICHSISYRPSFA